MQGNMNVCKCSHHKIIPALIALIGLTFLLGNVGVLTGGAVGLIWPILLILIGLQKMFKHMCTCCANP